MQEKCIGDGGEHGKDTVPQVTPGPGERKQQPKCLLLPPVCSLIRACSNNSGLEGTFPE